MSNKALGKGLSALMGDTNLNNITTKMTDEHRFIPIHIIHANNLQPRKTFKEDDLKDLAQSIKKDGILQPLIVRKSMDNSYEIITGERRWRAAIMAEVDQVPVIIRDLDDHAALRVAIIENVQRQDLSVIEEAEGYERLASEFGYTQEQIAEALSKSRSHISNLLRLLTLPKSIIELVKNDILSFGHARALINAQNIEKLAHTIVSKKLNVRQTEQLVKNTDKSHNNTLDKNQNSEKTAVKKTQNDTKFANTIQSLKKSLPNADLATISIDLTELMNESSLLLNSGSLYSIPTSWLKIIHKAENIIHNMYVSNILGGYSGELTEHIGCILKTVLNMCIQCNGNNVISEQVTLEIAISKFHEIIKNNSGSKLIVDNIYSDIKHINDIINNYSKSKIKEAQTQYCRIEQINTKYVINKTCSIAALALNQARIYCEMVIQNNTINSSDSQNFEHTT
ncbi:ParB family transcriptional regulator, chromosome partitioning protein [Candidatus Xenohaliotis californiensis]|uniref:Probable chromosome-partitioning protein ParB n=1 Tax=Candidatus Xenohaliotis californiensis TaxID=84677 RepID=A0ABM9N785_9RICK|nr:ParB family transcriptional regulator, chromosome partitioning protein [Candidatus Xenohaliotis californiensis]